MSIGSGLFFGLVCLSVVYLYSQTKDRWPWSAIARWVVAGLCVPLLAGAVWLGYSSVRSYIASRPKAVSRYVDVALGDSKDEVRYAKGQPTDVMWDEPGGDPGIRLDVKVRNIPKGKGVSDYPCWRYDADDGPFVLVDFSPTTQRVVRVFCREREQHQCPALLGVSAGTTEDQVYEALGKPGRVALGKMIADKDIEYRRLNVRFSLEKKRVYGLAIETADATAHLEAAVSQPETPR